MLSPILKTFCLLAFIVIIVEGAPHQGWKVDLSDEITHTTSDIENALRYVIKDVTETISKTLELVLRNVRDQDKPYFYH